MYDIIFSGDHILRTKIMVAIRSGWLRSVSAMNRDLWLRSDDETTSATRNQIHSDSVASDKTGGIGASHRFEKQGEMQDWKLWEQGGTE